MPLLKVPQCVIDDLERFISEKYQENLPISLLIAQDFIMEYPDHGKNYSLFIINDLLKYAFQNIVQSDMMNK
jgi:hypothetical protein